MNTTPHPGVQLADGFQFTAHLDAPYRLAWGHILSPCSAIVTANLDGSEQRELLDEDTTRINLTTCFSPDGRTLYGCDTRLWAMDVATGATQVLPDIPHASPFDRTQLLECSPDNSTLLLTQTTMPQMVRGSGPVMPTRLCRVSTQGTDFRILYLDPADCWLRSVGWLEAERQEPCHELPIQRACVSNRSGGAMRGVWRGAARSAAAACAQPPTH